MNFVLGGRSIGAVLARSQGSADTLPAWATAGGAPRPIACYQPKGAASLAESYKNLANPGTYDCTVGVAPTLGADGWTLTGTQYLIAPLTVSFARNWSFLARYANAGNNTGTVFGIRAADSSARVQIVPGRTGDNRQYIYGNSAAILTILGGGTPTGVMAIAGTTAYRNGSSDGAIPGANGAASALQLHIGARIFGATVDSFYVGSIAAFAIWNSDIGAYMSAVSAAVALI